VSQAARRVATSSRIESWQLDSDQLDSDQLDSDQLDSDQLDSDQLDSDQLDSEGWRLLEGIAVARCRFALLTSPARWSLEGGSEGAPAAFPGVLRR
jgi:hypothetical protein